MFDLKVLKTKISICAADTLTSGMVGEELRVSFSADWDGLNITAVFTDGTHTIDVLNPSEVIVIPHEILADAGARVRVGFYGYTIEDGNIVIAIPTVYAYLGSVKQGADPSGDESTEPSLPVWAQIQSDVNALENRIDGITQPTKVSQLENDAGYITAEDLPDIPSLDDYAKKQYVDDATTELKEDLDALDTRVTELEEHGGGGEGTSDHRQLTNRDAANQHPISAITGLQSALDGKQASGDYATSGELDALADIVDGKADAADIPSLAGYATEAYVQNYHDNTKQDIITDLATIRSGAALGATALQSVPSEYAKKTDIPTAEISANTAARHTHDNKALLDKIAEGGIGYTEGEATTIEWDGDTSGKAKHPAAPFYNISDTYVGKDSLIGAKIVFSDGTEHIISENDIEVSIEEGITLNTISATYFGVTRACLLTVSDDYGSILPKGTYFVRTSTPAGDIWVSSLTYGNETIHKIDTKYLPIYDGSVV